MKTDKQLENLVGTIYWHEEHGEIRQATSLLRQLQLDAMKEGMTMAARLCEGNEDYMPANNDECFDDIIKARDNLKELP